MSSQRNRTFKIGITGVYGAGKTLARRELEGLGFNGLDSKDILYTIVSANPTLTRTITSHFGNEVLDHTGNLSRRKIQKLMAANPIDKKLLQETIDPKIREEIKQFLYSPLGSYLRIVEDPNLFENDTQHLYDEVWVVKAPKKQVIDRIVERDNLTREEVELRLLTDWSQEKKVEMSDRIIENNDDSASMRREVRKVYDQVKNKVFSLGL